jgi:hypothetical protein
MPKDDDAADLVAALQLISQALGPDHEDDYERAVNAIRSPSRWMRSAIEASSRWNKPWRCSPSWSPCWSCSPPGRR